MAIEATSAADYVGKFFGKGGVRAHAVGACGRGPRPAVLLAAFATLALSVVAAPGQASAQATGGIVPASTGYVAVHKGAAVGLSAPVRRFDSTQNETVDVASYECNADGGGAVTVIGNQVYCGNRTVSSGDRPDFVVTPGESASLPDADRLAIQNHENLMAARRWSKK